MRPFFLALGLIASFIPAIVFAQPVADPKKQKGGLFGSLYSSPGEILSAQLLKDPDTIDAQHPPGMLELQIPSGKAMMNAIMYTADGQGPHPTVIMLHGFPGNEKNLDTAQMLRRAGFNVLYFHYRGAWGSGGDYSLANVVADARNAVAFIRSKAGNGRFRINGKKISLLGHSLGGFNALITGSRDQEILCTVAAAPADLVNFVSGADAKQVVSAAAENPVPGLKDYSYADLVRETLDNKATYELKSKMRGFSGRPLMIVTGDKDKVVSPAGQAVLANTAEAAGASPFQHLVLTGDHGFSWSRIAFNTGVVLWMMENCQ